MIRVSENAKAQRTKEHLPTLAVTAFWFWIMLFVFLCGCGALFISVVPIFPKNTVAPPISRPTEPALTDAPESIATLAPKQIATPPPVVAKVIEQRVNLRAAPSTDAGIVGKADKNAQFTLLGRSQDSKWYQVTLAGKTDPAWVFADTLQIVSGDPAALPVVKTP